MARVKRVQRTPFLGDATWAKGKNSIDIGFRSAIVLYCGVAFAIAPDLFRLELCA
jgi:hypothetical protein